MDKTIKNSTYTYVSANGGKITFASVNDIMSALSFSSGSTIATTRGSAGSVKINRNTIKLSVPFKASGADGATTKDIDVAKAASLEISAPTVEDAQDVIDEIIRVLGHPDAVKFLLGFKPNPASTFAPVGG